jgi:hypothetical protein
MNPPVKIILTSLAAFAAGAALVFHLVKTQPETAADAGGQSAADSAPQLKHDATGEMVITLNAEMQEHLGLKMAAPAVAQWQPEARGYGRVIDPAALTAAIADLESARTAAEASGKEFKRLKNLSEENISAKNLESARATATHDKLAFESTLAKFAQDWGQSLADGDDREKILSEVVNGTAGLVRIDLPAGETLPEPPASARIIALTDETKPVEGAPCSATTGVNPQTQSQSFFFLVKNRPLTLGSAVTGYLKMSGEPSNGVNVPSSAVLRYEGKNWVYVQTGNGEFARREIPLDRPVENGWFVSGDLTNRIVVTGAQTILSAELNNGNSAPTDGD